MGIHPIAFHFDQWNCRNQITFCFSSPVTSYYVKIITIYSLHRLLENTVSKESSTSLKMVTLSCSNSTPELVSLPVKTRRSNNKKGNKTKVCAKRQKKKQKNNSLPCFSQ